jgi:hypothetical protein
MVDYHPLISRAVAALQASTEESRRALYERVRNAQLAHLRQAAFTEFAIEGERIALEEAIRNVELRETAKQMPAPADCGAPSKEPALASGSRLASQSSRPRLFSITEDQRWVIWAAVLIIAMNAAGMAVLFVLMYAMN